MKKLFYVLLIYIFCMGLVSCAKTYSKISKSKTINTVFENSETSGSTIENSTIEDSSVKDSTGNDLSLRADGPVIPGLAIEAGHRQYSSDEKLKKVKVIPEDAVLKIRFYAVFKIKRNILRS